MFQCNSHLYVLVAKYRNENYILNLSLEVSRQFEFPHPCDGPRNSDLFFLSGP
jgi:hypothetical protein